MMVGLFGVYIRARPLRFHTMVTRFSEATLEGFLILGTDIAEAIEGRSSPLAANVRDMATFITSDGNAAYNR